MSKNSKQSATPAAAPAAPEIDLASLPLTRILVREKASLAAFEGPVFTSGGADISADRYALNRITPFPGEQMESPLASSSLRLAPVYDPSGKLLCLVPERAGMNLSLHNGADGSLLRELAIADAQKVEFSPSGRYLVTWSFPHKGTATTAPEGNLRVWDTSSGRKLAAFSQKSQRSDSATIQWSADERYCFRQGNDEIFVYEVPPLTADANTEEEKPFLSAANVVTRIEHKGFLSYQIAHCLQAEGSAANNVQVAVFNPEAKGKPARVTLYTVKLGTGLTAVRVEGPLTSRTIFGATEAKLMWNKTATSLLIHSQTDVDSSNTSYYGATGLYLMNVKGDISCKVEQTKEGPVHDMQWSPVGDKFIVAAGNMPSQSTLYNEKGEPIYQFGSAHRNTISFAPHGRFVIIAGFGNLAGEMDFYDLIRLKKLGSNVSHCATAYTWSPCSRYLLTASLAPRMNVDNNLKIFKYNGHGPVLTIPFDRAYDVMWKPTPLDVYPNRAPSPRRPGQTDGESGHAPSVTAAAAPVAAKPAAYQAYRPPGSSGALASMMREASAAATAAPVGKVKPAGNDGAAGKSSGNGSGSGAGGKFVSSAKARVIPGMAAPAAKPANNNNNNKPAAASSSAGKPAATNAPKPAPAPVAAPVVVAPPAPPAESAEESKEKKAKGIQKKLKQIQELKAKAASGQPLDADQSKKVATEASLLAELAALQL